MSRGKRVLALAFRRIADVDASHPSQLSEWLKRPREAAETGLTFAGFMVFDCDLKPDSKSVIRELRSSNHRVVMITGDSALTAADVAGKLGMTKAAERGLLILEMASPDATGTQSGLTWRNTATLANSDVPPLSDSQAPQTEDSDIPFDPLPQSLASLAQQYSLCVTGAALSILESGVSKAIEGGSSASKNILHTLCPLVTVFARVSPSQKVRSSPISIDDNKVIIRI